MVRNYGFKYFLFEDKNIKRQFSQTKAWAFTAEKNKAICGYNTVFVIDSEREDNRDYRIALNILKTNAEVINKDNVLAYIKNLA